MTKKKTSRKPATKKKPLRQGDKCAFIRGLPRSMPAVEVQARAEKLGMVLSLPYIHNIRSAAGKRSREVLQKTGRKPIKGTKAQKERLFLDLVVHLGPTRAKKLLEQAELALRSGPKT